MATVDDGEKGGMNRNHMQITTHDKFLLKNVPYRSVSFNGGDDDG